MATIKAFIKELEKMPQRMLRGSQIGLNSVIPSLIQDFKNRSPVDSGQYKRSWRKSNVAFSGTNVLASAGIINDDPKASIMEYGAEPKTPPWYFPNAKKPTGKLTVHSGRIWAGGLNPGHEFTIGGAIDPVLFGNKNRQLQIAKVVADSVMKRI